MSAQQKILQQAFPAGSDLFAGHVVVSFPDLVVAATGGQIPTSKTPSESACEPMAQCKAMMSVQWRWKQYEIGGGGGGGGAEAGTQLHAAEGNV